MRRRREENELVFCDAGEVDVCIARTGGECARAREMGKFVGLLDVVLLEIHVEHLGTVARSSPAVHQKVGERLDQMGCVDFDADRIIPEREFLSGLGAQHVDAKLRSSVIDPRNNGGGAVRTDEHDVALAVHIALGANRNLIQPLSSERVKDGNLQVVRPRGAMEADHKDLSDTGAHLERNILGNLLEFPHKLAIISIETFQHRGPVFMK